MNKDQIIEGISKMDIKLLALVLDENRSYCDTTKEIFLEKLQNKIFDEFTVYEDTFLIPYEGKCVSTMCSNVGCSGYSFVGNNSNCHLDLVFKETDHGISDIRYCHQFQTDDENVIREGKFVFGFSEDEKIDFIPTPEYAELIKQCFCAYTELIQEDVVLLHKEEYVPWLEKYKELFTSFPEVYARFNRCSKFTYLYSQLSALADCLNNEVDAKKALEEFTLIQSSDEALLQDWLVRYGSISSKFIEVIMYHASEEEMFGNGYIKLYEDKKARVAFDEFKNIYDFENIYNNLSNAIRNRSNQ